MKLFFNEIAMPLQDPSEKIKLALDQAIKIKGKTYHNANAHCFASDMRQIRSCLEEAIAICDENIRSDPYLNYLREIGKSEAENEQHQSGKPDGTILITEEWLKANGFRLVSERGDERTKPEVYLRRCAIKGDGDKVPAPFQCPFDLCIDIAPNPHKGDWFVWLFQEDPYRFVHVRQFRHQEDLIRLYEALTGANWKEMLHQFAFEP